MQNKYLIRFFDEEDKEKELTFMRYASPIPYTEGINIDVEEMFWKLEDKIDQSKCTHTEARTRMQKYLGTNGVKWLESCIKELIKTGEIDESLKERLEIQKCVKVANSIKKEYESQKKSFSSLRLKVSDYPEFQKFSRQFVLTHLGIFDREHTKTTEYSWVSVEKGSVHDRVLSDCLNNGYHQFVIAQNWY